ncbi:MAG: NTE family protein [bacterium]|nr:MAG: NTE family protein [bacterium]KAF0148631.1 MAG: NTE family protein [bacterium]KAF0167935.1 MAG: NTE family protein [bacterium]TXT17332.1 MAG: NTE family protein [bacterium]
MHTAEDYTVNPIPTPIPDRKRFLRFACLLAGLGGMAFLFGQPSVQASQEKAQASEGETQRPKIGLVLAGGGAKGAAHVGVLKVLEEMRIPIDFVAGTSMGSIVGGLYAAGLSPQEIEREIRTIDWLDVFNDDPARADRSFRRKQDDRLYVFKAKPGFNDYKIELPLAYIQGQKFDLQLSRLTGRVAGIKDFNHLPIPFSAVAADLETGQEVVLKSGSLARALRSSMAVPGAFDPVPIDDRLLVDGGIANNIPVSVARAMGADVVIVSDLGSEMLTREQITSALSVAGQLVNFLFGLNSEAALKTLGPRDVLISVKLGDIGAGSFDRIVEAIPLGEQAARRSIDSIGRYALSPEAYRRHVAARAQPKADMPAIAFIRVDNQSKVGDAVITSKISARLGQPLDVSRLEADLQQLYGLEIFESVRYEIVQEGEATGLLVHAREKSWGPGYLQTGMITSTNFEGESAFRLGLTYTLTQINPLNGEFRVAGQLGDEAGLAFELFQPLDAAADYYFNGRIGYNTQDISVYDRKGNHLYELYSKKYALDLALGRQFGTWGEVRVGYLREHGRADVVTGQPRSDWGFDTGMVYVRLSDDKLDNPYFPTSGHMGRLEWRGSRDSLGADSDFDQVFANYGHAYSWGRNTLFGNLSLGTTADDDAPVQSLYQLGGFMRLSGFEQDQLSGQHFGLAQVFYMRRINDIQFFKAYIGGALEAGNVWQDSSDFGSDLVYAGNVFLGLDTPIGPLYLSYGRNSESQNSLYLYLGPLFSF